MLVHLKRRNFGLKLNFESRTVAPPVSSWGLFAPNIDFLCMKAKAFRFHKTKRANNHIKQGDTLFFAHYPIGVTNDRLPAMLTNAIHARFGGQRTCHGHDHVPRTSKALRFNKISIFNRELTLIIRPKYEGNCIRFTDFCERFFYNGSLVTSWNLRVNNCDNWQRKRKKMDRDTRNWCYLRFYY